MNISVIIPVYNVEKYVERCILSIMSQTYTESVECIVVNDCTPDNSMKIIKGKYNLSCFIMNIIGEWLLFAIPGSMQLPATISFRLTVMTIASRICWRRCMRRLLKKMRTLWWRIIGDLGRIGNCIVRILYLLQKSVE